MTRSPRKIKVNSKNFGSFDGVEIEITPDLWEKLEKRKTNQGNLIDSLKNGRGLNGFKHLIEKIKTHNKDNKIIFTDEESRKDGKRFFINLDDYRKKTGSRFFALYRETGLDGASFFLNQNFPDIFEYDKARVSDSQLKKIDKNLPQVLKNLSSKVKNKKVIMRETSQMLTDLRREKKLLKSQIEELEKLKNASNILFFQQGLAELKERLTGPKEFSETSGKNSWQSWIYRNNWLFGTHYQTPIEKGRIGFRSIPDFLFPTIDGFFDILEIKLPSADAIIADTSHPGSYRWSSKASEAIGQVVNYLHEMEIHQLLIAQNIEREYGENLGKIFSIKPRAFVLIGEKDGWSPARLEGLRKLNYSLHGIEVLTYTDIYKRGQQIIDMYTKEISET